MITYKISSGIKSNTSGKTIYVKDITGNVGDITYTLNPDSGEYTPVTNTTGYTDAEPRLDFKLYLFATITKINGGKVTVDIEDYNPLTVIEWTINPTEDGVIKFTLCSVPSDIIVGDTLDELEEYIVATSDTLYLSNNKDQLIEYNSKKNDLLFSNTDIKSITKFQKLYEDLFGLIQGTIYEYSRGNKELAQRNVEFMNNSINLI